MGESEYGRASAAYSATVFHVVSDVGSHEVRARVLRCVLAFYYRLFGFAVQRPCFGLGPAKEAPIPMTTPNYRAGVDAGRPLLFASKRHWPGTTQHGC